MRVIAGTARSLPLDTPKGSGTRPTTDRIKETLFNILMPYLCGGVFLDLFAGSGGIGIEALSRGEQKAYFAERDRQAAAVIRKNLAFTKFQDRSTLLVQDVNSALPGIHEKEADVIFMDPPYGQGLEKDALQVLSKMPYVTKDTLIVVEADLTTDFSYAEALGFELFREKRYKTNRHMFLQKREGDTR